MKKITLLFLVLLSSHTVLAQFTFPTVSGFFDLQASQSATVNLNDATNTAGVTAGVYSKINISVDWQDLSPAIFNSEESSIELFIGGGSVLLVAPPTTGGAPNNTSTTLIFEGIIPSFYDPSVSGNLDIEIRNTSENPDEEGGVGARWSNIIVTLIPKPLCPEPTNIMGSNITATFIDLSWTAGENETLWNIELVNITAGGSQTMIPTESGLTSTSYTATGLIVDNTYLAYLQADCGSTNGTSNWSTPYEFTTEFLCQIPTNLTLDSTVSSSATFSWDEMSVASDGYLIEVFFAGSNVNNPFNSPAASAYLDQQTTTSHTFTSLIENIDYDVYIRSVCDDTNNIRSERSLALTFKTEENTLSSKSFEKSTIKFYPNPVEDLLNIETDYEIETFSVLNSLGQEVLISNKLLNNQINTSSLKSGIYFLRLKVDNTEKVLRIIKK
ncbi:T9SS type A sorting domain-containing protein [uncultured Algibacter sp.]|uniref:T9SS type A sorting domain-containing protein n=1 Tax=uncultured Algibacter sp. TaxID=298659 RepID=UPI003218056D